MDKPFTMCLHQEQNSDSSHTSISWVDVVLPITPVLEREKVKGDWLSQSNRSIKFQAQCEILPQ